MQLDERNRTTEPFFNQIHGVTAYRGVDETLIQVFTPVHRAAAGEAGRFLRIADSDGMSHLGQAVLDALDLAGNPHARDERQGWMIMGKSIPEFISLWKTLVQKAATCLVERNAFSITITPTMKMEQASGFAPLEKSVIHLPLDADPTELGEQLFRAFEMCN